jgi:predicted hydrocarbon binding protein
MPERTTLTNNNMVAIPRQSLAVLRETLLREGGPAAASFLQESGYAGGEAVAADFERWLATQGFGPMGELSLEAFNNCLSDFATVSGWGSIEVEPLNDAVAALDSNNWWEADPESKMDHPGCHISTGLLADMLGRVSGEPLAVLEVQCRSMGSERCRFLTGSAEALERVYERMVRGFSYIEAVESLID